MSDQVEMVHSRMTSKGNLRMWGQLYVSRTGRTVGGWVVNSWSEFGAPYWRPKMHWFDRKENKLCQMHLEFGQVMQVHPEDTDIEPERAKFIRETVDKWEREWLAEEAKKL
jgi:hypothetical protein